MSDFIRVDLRCHLSLSDASYVARQLAAVGVVWLRSPTTTRSAAHGNSAPNRPPGTEEAICLIHEAGGRAFLAHPLAGLRTIDRLEEVLTMLQCQGLDGLEVFHKPYPESTQRDLPAVAERRGLLTVTGSGFHGLRHSDGGGPGVNMPLEHWDRFMAAPGLERRAA